MAIQKKTVFLYLLSIMQFAVNINFKVLLEDESRPYTEIYGTV